MSTQKNTPALLRSHELRVTPQRLAIADLALHAPVHLTARAAFETLRTAHPAISMNTIYLTLGQFESAGLLHSFEINGKRVFDSNITPHDHACCNQCGAIIDLAPASESPPPAALSGWVIDREQRIWKGCCPECR